EVVAGQAILTTGGSWSHNGILLKVEGIVNLHLSANAVGLFEAFSSTIKPLQLMALSKEVQPAGKLAEGKIAIPFEFKLQQTGTRPLLDTYHGVYISVQYNLTVEMLKSGMFGQNLMETTEFIVEENMPSKSPKEFTMSSENIKKSRGTREQGHTFNIRCRLDSTTMPVTQPLSGKIMVEETNRPVKSINLQLIRVETINGCEGSMKEASEVQNVQLGVGNVKTGVDIPVHVILPRLFTSPTIHQTSFQLDFEANVVVEFENDFSVIENVPLTFYRL
ncbi:down syndrome critical region protein 3, partial [Guillardia theta CCMP2712]